MAALSTFGAILAIIGTALVVALVIDRAIAFASHFKRRRPISPSDEVFGDVPNLSSLFHARKDRP